MISIEPTSSRIAEDGDAPSPLSTRIGAQEAVRCLLAIKMYLSWWVQETSTIFCCSKSSSQTFLTFSRSWWFYVILLLRVIKSMKMSKLLVTSFFEQQRMINDSRFLTSPKKDTTFLNESKKVPLYFQDASCFFTCYLYGGLTQLISKFPF